jgi:hypothetical protein
MNDIPEYIEKRIRKQIPKDCCVVPNSTPVVSFGDVRTARVATLGLNPSRAEFYKKGKLLEGSDRRLETLVSLGLENLDLVPQEAVIKVWEGCNNYFQNRPYWRWFLILECMLNRIGSSYMDGDACHLDLVQWATDPVWSGLKNNEHTLKLLNSDWEFFTTLLTEESNHLELLLLNGNGKKIRQPLKVNRLNLLPATTKIPISSVGVGTSNLISA